MRWAVAAGLMLGLGQAAHARTPGDTRTIMLGSGEAIRLFDVLTPNAIACECNRECILGGEVEDFLRHTIATSGSIRVERYGIDRDGTVRGKVFVGNKDLSMLLIEHGLARPATSFGTHWCS
jgi:endonuclease YncB( thermonuclease family)